MVYHYRWLVRSSGCSFRRSCCTHHDVYLRRNLRPGASRALGCLVKPHYLKSHFPLEAAAACCRPLSAFLLALLLRVALCWLSAVSICLDGTVRGITSAGRLSRQNSPGQSCLCFTPSSVALTTKRQPGGYLSGFCLWKSCGLVTISRCAFKTRSAIVSRKSTT